MEKIGVGGVYLGANAKKYVNEALDSGRLSAGEMVYKFEKQFAKLHAQKYGIALNSGTSALHVALEALKVKYNLNSVRGGGTAQSHCPCYNFYCVVKCLHSRGIGTYFR